MAVPCGRLVNPSAMAAGCFKQQRGANCPQIGGKRYGKIGLTRLGFLWINSAKSVRIRTGGVRVGKENSIRQSRNWGMSWRFAPSFGPAI